MSAIQLDNWKADIDRAGNLVVFGMVDGKFFESMALIPKVSKGNQVMQATGPAIVLKNKDDGAWDQRLGLKSPILHGLLKQHNLI
jgi:hypothetical protein